MKRQQRFTIKNERQLHRKRSEGARSRCLHLAFAGDAGSSIQRQHFQQTCAIAAGGEGVACARVVVVHLARA